MKHDCTSPARFPRQCRASPARGFTLIEMGVAIVVLALLLGSILVPLATQVEQRQIGDTQKAMDEIKEALLGYALAQTPPHLPCPDQTSVAAPGIANDGIEDFDPATGLCRAAVSINGAYEGNVPWATLGVAPVDSWGNRFRYRVNIAFANRAPSGTILSLSSGPTLNVYATSALATVVANNVPAVILSHGKNGLGAITSRGTTNPAPTSGDELANTNADSNFVSRAASPADAPAGEFDDVVTWLSHNVLFNRLVSAGKLP